MWPADARSVPVALLFLGAWVVGGAALLWAGGRFIARIPRATLGRSLLARLLHGVSAWGVLGLARLLYALIGQAGRHPAFAEAMVITAATLLSFWLIISWSFGAPLGKAMLAWLPMAGEVFVVLPLALLLPELPFWG
jgi:hypothetical protein